MDMQIHFPSGKRVFADNNGFTIETDQPARGGGDDSAPAPFDLFPASIGTCAGIYALGFVPQRGIDPQGSRITMRTHFDQAPASSAGSTSNWCSPPSSPRSTGAP